MPDEFAQWTLCEQVARDLFERETDVGELQKLADYARRQTRSKAVFDLIAEMQRGGQFVRSKSTPGYYRDMGDVCDEYLHEYRAATGDKAHEMALILGWAARLIRYYGTDEGYEEYEQRQAATPLTHTPPPVQNTPRPAPPAAKHVPRLETKRESVTVQGAVSGGKAAVETESGMSVPCKDIPYFQSSPRFRADVFYEDGKPTRAIFKGWK